MSKKQKERVRWSLEHGTGKIPTRPYEKIKHSSYLARRNIKKIVKDIDFNNLKNDN